MKVTDYYQVLGVTRQAAGNEIRQAYRKLAKRFHPDVNPGNPDAALKFKQIVEAYETLSDEAKRIAYDERLAQGGKRTSESKKSPVEPSGGNVKASQGSHFDPTRVQEQFAQFFGKTPKGQTDTKSNQKGAKAGNPLDTSDMFEHFMGYRKK
ncbi:DnaJ domain-containing protein [Paenibacillus sp.]|jgi:molecular chaperone DnaJ|uniref:J domain-containing protein n=1 Tax=Paenibacillus sp. TaxID=58172 RepID=UPI00282F8A67|nr:DnaJ domain-containing protein [Paenibacillus sp.]MDR0267391.1 DnaJ domain-containing protein [Paenibacillus sp.]